MTSWRRILQVAMGGPREIEEAIEQVRHVQGVGQEPIQIPLLLFSRQIGVPHHQVDVASH